MPMAANGCPLENGETEVATSSQTDEHCSLVNGEIKESSSIVSVAKPLSVIDRDIVRLIGQHLRSLGLK